MKRLVLAAVLAALPLSAHSADLYTGPTPSFDQASPQPTGFDWAGFYLGANAGYLWGKSYLFDASNPFNRTDNFDRDGFIGGGQLGYNFQTGPWVLGVEADIQYSDASGTANVNCGPNCSADLQWFGTVRGRVGFSMDRWLLYATGGWAYGKVETNAPPFSFSETLTGGWTAGGGVEYGFARNWTAKVEYLYMDLGDSTSTPLNYGGQYDTNNIVRFGVNYLFK